MNLFSDEPRGVREFLQKNHAAVLWTLIIHLVVLIILVFAKTQGLKRDMELGVKIDFTEEVPDDKQEEALPEIPAEFMEKIREARVAASNRAVNLNDISKEDISTEDYVNQLMSELEAEKDPEFLKNREKWEEIIASGVFEDDNPEESAANDSDKDDHYTGPTTITYKFLDQPLGRQKRYLAIPVYRCEGSAIVVVDVVVRPDGSVSDASLVSSSAGPDNPCFSDAAVSAARSSVFRIDLDAPEKQHTRITYQFIAQ